MSNSIEQLGFSKINIGLAITGKRDDGYHDIDSIFQSIRLSDSIYFTKHHSVVFSGIAPELPQYIQDLIPYNERNLALKALREVQSYTGCRAGAAIHLLKRVPAAAGLGGGSADAAAMLLGLNKFWDLRLTTDELLTLGSKLGSDVPFLLQGGTARGTGRGEILTYHPSPAPHWLLLVKPEVSVSTATAYGRYNSHSKATSTMITNTLQHIKENDLKQAFLTSSNTFEELLFSDHEELVTCKEFFSSRGYPTIMTGSGPTMVVLLDKATEALALQEEITSAGHNWLSLITKTCTQEDIH